MCISSTEPRGPYRCSAHAREGYEKSRDTHASERFLATQLNTEAQGLNAASIATQESMIANQRIALDQTRGADEREAAQERYDADQASYRSLHGQLVAAHDAMATRALALRNAHDSLARKRAQYDATNEGVGALSIQINQLDRRALTATPDEAARLRTEAAALHDRRSAAEALMAHEANGRNGNWAEPAEGHAWNEETSRWIATRDSAGARIAAASTEAERAEASAAHADAEAKLRTQFERERFVANLRPHRAAILGDATLDERAAWGDVASSHRRTISSTGEPRYEVNLFRNVDGEVRATKFEVPAREFDAAVQQAGLDDHENITRYPTTSQVMRYVSHGVAQHTLNPSRQEFRAAGGSGQDYNRFERCHDVFTSLFAVKEAA